MVHVYIRGLTFGAEAHGAAPLPTLKLLDVMVTVFVVNQVTFVAELLAADVTQVRLDAVVDF